MTAIRILAVLATTLPLAAEQALEPLEGEGELVRAWAIENLYKAASVDDRVSATVVAVTAGHTHNSNRLVATIWDAAPAEGESLHSTTFDLGRVNGLEPPLRLDKVNDRLYRLSYQASVSDTFENALLLFTYDLHLADDGGLTRVVPVLAFSSYWDMDGSRMGLVASGNQRSIYYVEPKAGSTATPSKLFFHGTSDGKTYQGKILNWQWKQSGEPPEAGADESAQTAEGEIQDDGKTVVLKARATEYQDGQMVPVGPSKTHTLHFMQAAAPER